MIALFVPTLLFPTRKFKSEFQRQKTSGRFAFLRVLGDGFRWAVADQTLNDLAAQQCKSSHRKICGQVLQVPIVEAPGQMSVGRFGWKDQHASLLSFAA